MSREFRTSFNILKDEIRQKALNKSKNYQNLQMETIQP